MTIADIKDLWWLVTVVIIGGVVTIFRIGWKSRTQAHRIETLESCAKRQHDDISQLVLSQLAVLDGLKQLHCNGEVTVAYKNLKEHLAKKE